MHNYGQTDRQTDTTKIIYHATSRVVSKTYLALKPPRRKSLWQKYHSCQYADFCWVANGVLQW